MNEDESRLTTLSDEELMELYRKQGSEAAFAALYQRHSGRVYSYLSRRLASRQELDELHQAVFLKFHQSRALYDPKYPVLQWLFVIARTSLTDHLRKSERTVHTVDEPEAIEAQPAPEAEMESVTDTELLQSLPEREQLAVKMRVLEEKSYGEISAILGQSEASARQMISRALRKLKAAFQAKGEHRS